MLPRAWSNKDGPKQAHHLLDEISFLINDLETMRRGGCPVDRARSVMDVTIGLAARQRLRRLLLIQPGLVEHRRGPILP